ncbi:hypothetical protein FRC01_009283, partial [Tulasnella sp. 417]
PNGSIIAIPQLKAKRKQVKSPCTNCQKACKKCDEVRPCTRCIKYGIDKDCVDSQRKERKKGIKRGPYMMREPKTSSSSSPSSSAQHHIQIQPAMLPAQMQLQKAPDGSLQYPPQYYIATQPVVSASNGEGSSRAGSMAQQVQLQKHTFPSQYFGQMAYAGLPSGYVVQQPGAGNAKDSWSPRD